MLERLIGWIFGNLAEAWYGGMNFDLDDEESV